MASSAVVGALRIDLDHDANNYNAFCSAAKPSAGLVAKLSGCQYC